MPMTGEPEDRSGAQEDYRYELSDEELRHGLSMTPLERLQWLDEARRFVLALRAAPRTYYEGGRPARVVLPTCGRIAREFHNIQAAGLESPAPAGNVVRLPGERKPAS